MGLTINDCSLINKVWKTTRQGKIKNTPEGEKSFGIGYKPAPKDLVQLFLVILR